MVPKQFCLTFILVFLKIILTSCERRTSLTFVVDDTLSMTQEIRQVKEGAQKILNIILDKRSSQIENLIHISLNDPEVLVKTVTTDRRQFEESLASVTTHGAHNRDWAEPAMEATKLAMERSLPGSDVYVFTDSPAKDIILYDDVVSLCQKKQIQVVFVLTEDFEGYEEDNTVQVFYKIAQACSGQAFVLEKNDVEALFPYITETSKGTKNVITSIRIPPKSYVDVNFTIDDKTEFAIVSTAGPNVKLEIRGPSLKTEHVTWIANVKSMKLLNPLAGEYVARVWSSNYASVIVFARTDFTFVHGFSELIPKLLKDTIAQPITGTKSHLSVSVTDSDHNLRIMSVQILDMNEKLIMEKPLRKIDGDLYTTDALLWPEHRFKIAIIGQSVHTQRQIRRLANTPIQPQKPKPPNKKIPVVNIQEGAQVNVSYSGDVVLTCSVNAYPPPIIKWKNIKGEEIASKSAIVELPYKHISYLKLSQIKSPGKYYCSAINDEGESNLEYVTVNVNSPFTIQDYDKGIKRISYKTEGTLKCQITSNLPMNIIWEHLDQITRKWIIVKPKKGHFSISDDETELKIISIDLYEEGVYRCSSILKDGYKGPTIQQSVQITNLIRPLLSQLPPQIIVKRNAKVVISCKVRYGNPKSKVEILFKDVDSYSYDFLKLTDEELVITNAQLSDAGRYKCAAVNVAGRDDTQTELIVEAPPTLLNNDKNTYYAVEDDLALRIPCDVEGYPKPVITWKKNGALLQSDEKYKMDDNYLVIKKPKADDSNIYTCTATNKEGTTEKKINVVVTEELTSDDQLGNRKPIYILENKPINLTCLLPISDTDTVRWYVGGFKTNVTGKHLYLKKEATTFEDGNYTCRVSDDQGSVSETYVVDVGKAPLFRQPDVPPKVTINWDGNDRMIDCEVTAKPHETSTWTYNGKTIKSASTSEQTILGWGTYTCRMSNIHGSVERKFKVTSRGCLINRHFDKSPIIVNDEKKLTNLGDLKNFMQILPESTLHLSCRNGVDKSNYFERISNETELDVQCDHEDKFQLKGELYNFSQFQCHQDVTPSIHRTGEKCLKENTELIHVGFEGQQFINVYDVCLDTIQNIPLYTRVDTTDENIVDETKLDWYNIAKIKQNVFENTYNCVASKKTCCYDKRQLVNRTNIVSGPAQKTSFISQMNAVPVWIPCNKHEDPWTTIEKAVTDYREYSDSMTIWSGVSKVENLDGKFVPRYIWKVLSFDDGDVKVIVHVNNPSPKESDVLCKNVCVDVEWMARLDMFTYCCELNEFSNKFQLDLNIFSTTN